MKKKEIIEKNDEAITTVKHICTLLDNIRDNDVHEDAIVDEFVHLNFLFAQLYTEYKRMLSSPFFNTKIVRMLSKTLDIISELNGYFKSKLGARIDIDIDDNNIMYY